LRHYSAVARLAARFSGRGWKLRGSTQTVRRHDLGDNHFLGRLTMSLIGYMPTLKRSYTELYVTLHGLAGRGD